MAILEAQDLVKIYPGGVKAVDRVSFTVEEGEIFGFLGPNGAGKTTTIRMGVTLLAPTSGRIAVDGIDVTQRPEEVRRRIGYAAQAVGVDDDLTARENLILQGRLYGLSTRQAAEKAAELLEVIDLADAANRRAGTFSGGMRKRLDLAQALVHHPRLLFLDEPTTGLDPQNRRALWSYLRELNESGVTIFLTTQYLEEADVLCGRLAIIDHGQLRVEGAPAALKAGLGGDMVTVTVSSEAADGALERTHAVLAAVPGCQDVTTHDSAVTVVLQDGASQLAGLVRALDAAQVPVARLELAEPTLDDVFLRHTGERLRVEGSQAAQQDAARPPEEEVMMGRVLREIHILWGRNMRKLVRIPMLLFFSLFQPLLFLILFSQVFSSMAKLPGFGYDNYLQFLVPTIVGLTALNSAFQSGMGMVNDMDAGLLDKFLIAPIRRSSILLGKIVADATRMSLQALLIIALSFIMGARFKTGVPGVLAMILIAVLFGIAWAGISNVVALRTRNAELTMLIGILITFPVLFLSTGFMPSSLLPSWLETVAEFNPITYLVAALRALVNEGWDWTAIWQCLAVTLGLALVTLTAATRAFRRVIG